MTMGRRVATRYLQALENSLPALLGTYERLAVEAAKKIRQGENRDHWPAVAAGVGKLLLDQTRMYVAAERFHTLVNDGWIGTVTTGTKIYTISDFLYRRLKHDPVLTAAMVVRLMQLMRDRRSGRANRLLVDILGDQLEGYQAATDDVQMKTSPAQRVQEWVEEYNTQIQYWLPQLEKYSWEVAKVIMGEVLTDANFHSVARLFPDSPGGAPLFTQGLPATISGDLHWDGTGCVAFAYAWMLKLGKAPEAQRFIRALQKIEPDWFRDA